MMNGIYSQQRADALKRAARTWRWISVGILLAGLAACILLCTGVTTANAPRRQLYTVLTAVLSGWIAIGLWVLAAQPTYALARHFDGILAGEEVQRTGVLLSVGEKIFLPKSVVIRKVRVQTDAGEEILSILADRVGLLPEPGTAFTVTTVRSYITGTEDCHA